MTTKREICPKCGRPRLTSEEWEGYDDRSMEGWFGGWGSPDPKPSPYTRACLCLDGGAFGEEDGTDPLAELEAVGRED
jgi:hypothetical protein